MVGIASLELTEKVVAEGYLKLQRFGVLVEEPVQLLVADSQHTAGSHCLYRKECYTII